MLNFKMTYIAILLLTAFSVCISTVQAAAIPGCAEEEPKPWELKSKDCETFLSNIHYADAVMNEQVADLRLGSGANKYFQIDRLIYPVIGAPNLFFGGTGDELVVMLNLEDALYEAWLKASTAKDSDQELKFKKWDAKNSIKIYLTARDDATRAKTTGKKALKQKKDFVMRVEPSSFWRHGRTDDMPAGLKDRAKIKVIIGAASVEKIPVGFYDIRVDIKTNGTLTSEFQYNAVRIFETGYDQANANVLNVTDSQVSLGIAKVLKDAAGNKSNFANETQDRLRQFIVYLKTVWEKDAGALGPEENLITESAFITFNGDVHNGGGPTILKAKDVAPNYRDEAVVILDMLKDLPLPIFLTAGNHDGYVAMGHVPTGKTIKVFGNIKTVAKTYLVDGKFPQFVEADVTIDDYMQYLDETSTQKGGRPVDVFSGAYIRYKETEATKGKYGGNWFEVNPAERNYPLYDGFNQWKRTYGPLYQSWVFGKNHYINLNSYELRQHMRSGWGMYTVNYGGGISQPQNAWVKREIAIANEAGREILLLAHHDPRGGHKGANYPFYYRQVPYAGMVGVAKDFALGEYLLPKLCGALPEFVKASNQTLAMSCMQDGLQEWMRPDSNFDCYSEDMYTDADVTAAAAAAGGDDSWKEFVIAGRCNLPKLAGKKHRVYSGYQLVHKLANEPGLRTMLLGHTHYNSMEVLPARRPENQFSDAELDPDKDPDAAAKQQAQDAYDAVAAVIPDMVVLDAQSQKKYGDQKSLWNKVNPLRWHWFSSEKKQKARQEKAERLAGLKKIGIVKASCQAKVGSGEFDCYALDLAGAGHGLKTVRQGNELVILRLTSVANLSEQKQKTAGSKTFGFSILKFSEEHVGLGGAGITRLNDVAFFVNNGDGFAYFDNAQIVRTYLDDDQIIRSSKIHSSDPMNNTFNWLYDTNAVIPAEAGPNERGWRVRLTAGSEQ